MKRWMIVLLIFVLTGIVSATVVSDDCNENESICTLPFDAEDYQALGFDLEPGESQVIVQEDSHIIFVYRVMNEDVNHVWMCCGIQAMLSNVEGDIWGRRFYIERLDEAVIGYYFTEQVNNQHIGNTNYQVWRGDNAPPELEKSDPLLGTVHSPWLDSEALNERRRLTIYLPPEYNTQQSYPVVYAADGSSVAGFAPYIETLILSEQITPLILVGVHSGEHRAAEYLPSREPERFAAHETFFTEEVRLWAESNLNASDDPEKRAVYGHSNGGVFATAMALRHPDIYEIAFPFSAGMDPFTTFTEERISPDLQLYFTAGTLESSFYVNTQELARRFEEANAEVIWHPRVAGHDFIMWQEELTHAITWAFSD